MEKNRCCMEEYTLALIFSSFDWLESYAAAFDEARGRWFVKFYVVVFVEAAGRCSSKCCMAAFDEAAGRWFSKFCAVVLVAAVGEDPVRYRFLESGLVEGEDLVSDVMVGTHLVR